MKKVQICQEERQNKIDTNATIIQQLLQIIKENFGKCSFGNNCYFFHPETVNVRVHPSQYKLKLNYPEDFQIDQEEIERYNIKLKIPFKMQDQRDELILIRHGLSYYNYASSDFYFHTGFGFADQESKSVYQTNPNFIDSELHPYGILMSENNSQNLHGINVVAVFVSPLARAIQTAYHLFKNHPNQINIKFIILPELTEILSKVQDISNIRKQMNSYDKIFDFSYMKDFFDQNLDFWQIYNLTNEDERKNIINFYQNQFYDKENSQYLSLQEIILQMMDQKFPSAIEKVCHVYERAMKAKQIIQQYIIDNKLNTLNQKVVVISHNNLIQNLTAYGVSETGSVQKGESMENCQMKSIKLF